MNFGQIVAEPGEARLASTSSDDDSSSCSSPSSDVNDQPTELVVVSGQHFGVDLQEFNQELASLSERLDFLSIDIIDIDAETMDSIEDDIVKISEDIDSILLMRRYYPVANIQVFCWPPIQLI